MSRTLAFAMAIAAGCLVGMQAPVNARLGRSVGGVQAATFSFIVGTVALLLVASAVARGGLANLRHVSGVPWWALVGGLFGAVYVGVALATVRTLGVSGLTGAVIAGQLTVSVAIDRLGLFGVAQQSVSITRIIGLCFLVVGVVLVVRT
ncbi:MAG: DMT family transporter [Solirubrobacteraceae bacterium]